MSPAVGVSTLAAAPAASNPEPAQRRGTGHTGATKERAAADHPVPVSAEILVGGAGHVAVVGGGGGSVFQHGSSSLSDGYTQPIAVCRPTTRGAAIPLLRPCAGPVSDG